MKKRKLLLVFAAVALELVAPCRLRGELTNGLTGYTLSPAGQDQELWLKTDALNLNHLDPVSTWPDSSGWGCDAAQSGVARPLFLTNTLNGLPVLRFDGSDDFMNVADNDAWAFTNCDLFIVLRIQETSPWWTRAWLAQDEGSGGSSKWIWSHNGSTQVWHINSPGGGTGSPGETGSAWTPSSEQFYILELRKQGNDYVFYEDGNSNGAFTCAIPIPNANHPLTVGMGEQSPPFEGDISEVLIYGNALDDRQRQRTGYYLQNKYGLDAVYVPGSTQQLEVVSAIGVPTPETGTNRFLCGAQFDCCAPSNVIVAGIQYVCAGWEMTGNEPASGSSNRFTLTLTNDATLTWQWQTNYSLAISNSGPGRVEATNGWLPYGFCTNLVAYPSNYCHFVIWTGTLNSTSNPLPVTMDQAYFLVASFAENLATKGTPEWWLAQYGWTNNACAAETNDADHDGMLTWQEWVAGCNPADSNSVFRFTSMGGASGEDMVIRWPSISNRFYDLTRSTNMALGTNGFFVLSGGSNMPATPTMNSYTDTVQGVGPYFYRIGVHE